MNLHFSYKVRIFWREIPSSCRPLVTIYHLFYFHVTPLFGPLWFYTVHFSPIWSTLVLFSSLRFYLVSFGPIQSYLILFGHIGFNLVHFGFIQSI